MNLHTFGQLNISKLSTHSELALSNFLETQGISLMALQETGPWEPLPDLFRNYSIYQNNLSNTNNLAGVALVIDNNLYPEEIADLGSSEVDAIWCQIIIGGKRILTGSVYCKPACSKTVAADNPITPAETFEALLENIKDAIIYAKSHNVSSILTYGDFNARSKEWGDKLTTPRARLLSEFVEKEEMEICCPFENTFVCASEEREGHCVLHL